MQAGRIALTDETGACALHFGHSGELFLYHVRQRQILEEVVHELFTRQFEHEVVHAFRVFRGTAAGPAATAAVGAIGLVAAHELAVAGVDDIAPAARAVMEHRLGHVLGRDGNLFAALQISHLAAGNRLRHGFAYLLPETAQKALPVDGAAVFCGQAAVDELAHASVPIRRPCGRADTIRPAAAPACRCSLWSPCAGRSRDAFSALRWTPWH